jgi:hypothetical protein
MRKAIPAENQRQFEMKVVVTLVCIAAVLAVVAVFRHLTAAEVGRTQRSTQEAWQLYEAQTYQFSLSQLAEDLLRAEESEKSVERHVVERKRLEQQRYSTQERARKGEEARPVGRAKEFRLRFGQGALEVALLIALGAVVTRRQMMWFGAVMLALLGSAIAAVALRM